MPSYTVREWDKLTYGDGEGQIPPLHADRLASLAAQSAFAGRGGGGVLDHGRHALRARGVVGILATHDCSLEILPKIDVAPGETIDHQNAAIRKRLIHMLAVALDLKIDLGAVTDLAWQRETLLEILIRIFCDKLTEALRKGMPRRYVGHEEDLPTLRGRLDITRQFTRHAVNPSRLACRFDLLSEDVALNRIMKAAISHVSRISRRPANQQRLRELAFVYADITDVPVSGLRWDEAVIDRTNRPWRDLFAMARLFLRGRYQTTTGGTGQGTALLFEMNTLFEEYVGRLIARALAGTEFTVSLQGGRLFCLSAEDSGRGLFQTKPDILIRRSGFVVHVIDTKWKRIASRIDDPKQGVSQADIYQMMAYAQLYHAPRLTLLYPHHPGLSMTEAVHAQHRITGHTTLLETATIDVSSSIDMLARLRRLLLCEDAAVSASQER
ncbi:McrBC 5-methylcytosine restriction system component [Sphingobium herbicidovorans NBRC 16415]|uniref:McrBC 5-methylcytosine restriction system component n=1 Tax=Sphingobium herbicidovorans (strain ATCC 700291 / DSM 11019 / CCUG 56400 / KCTC 2939 / LMG 18315 / NBRC 16415 / MH) TaxID=1219045 RepID=A0A086PDU1_SPHHM|nr:McrBC 5-methylcytosine restriction system component [Sphingobium herbicidovorans]KFG91559.1 McrBC 5-methylcytosine restriction system component [Sphingobium herbicidovorans NBRC 16415]